MVRNTDPFETFRFCGVMCSERYELSYIVAIRSLYRVAVNRFKDPARGEDGRLVADRIVVEASVCLEGVCKIFIPI
jgi:hypothetical protein